MLQESMEKIVTATVMTTKRYALTKTKQRLCSNPEGLKILPMTSQLLGRSSYPSPKFKNMEHGFNIQPRIYKLHVHFTAHYFRSLIRDIRTSKNLVQWKDLCQSHVMISTGYTPTKCQIVFIPDRSVNVFMPFTVIFFLIRTDRNS